jgi:hypothetical protein
MEAINYSISALSLATMRPEFGVADFAETRREPRTFPKDKAERETYQYLLRLMQASPYHQRFTKAELEKDCRWQFGVTVESFEKYCWPEAIKISGACWDRPGRRPRR